MKFTTPQHPPSPAAPQARAAEPIDSTARVTRRKRIAQIHQGALDTMDAAVEARRDTEQVAAEYQVSRSDVQDIALYRTRRLLRKLEGEIRTMRTELRGRWAA